MDAEYFIGMNASASTKTCEGVCQSPTTWDEVAKWLDDNEGSSITVCKNCVKDPQSVGMTRATGWPVGQVADWRMTFDDCRDLHVQDFGSSWTAHIDMYSPKCGVVRHALTALPKFSILTSAITGGLGGWIFGSPLIGAATGVVQGVGAVLIARATRPVRKPVCNTPGGCP